MNKRRFTAGRPAIAFASATLLFFFTILSLSRLGSYITAPFEPVTAAPVDLPIVILDAGHGGEDCGAVGVNGVLEKDLNLQIALLLEKILNANGIRTVMTRSEDVLLYDKNSDYKGQKKIQDLATRRKIAEEYENAVFVSIHMNAFPQTQYSGLQVYYSANHPNSQALAEEIQSVTKQLLQPRNERKIKSGGENIYLLERLSCPAVLIECGFLSNSEECEKLSDPSYQEELALTIGVAICRNLSLFGT